MDNLDYKKLISKLRIVNKEGQSVFFELNGAQSDFMDNMTNKSYLLKARQLGMSSLILAIFTWDFLLKPNSRSVCISHDSKASQKLLDRVKYFLNSLEDQGVGFNFKYNSRNELFNADKNSSFYIGAAGSGSFGRGDTLTNLHLSEFAFYPNPQEILSSALQAVVPSGRAIIETTARGFNYAKDYWTDSELGNTGFKTYFYGPEWEYSKEYLEQKKKELGRLYMQEFPSSASEAFLTSGDLFFSKEALMEYLKNAIDPISTDLIYA